MDDATLQTTVEAFPLPALVIGADERIVAASDASLRLFGPGIMGRHYITSLRHPAILDLVELVQRQKRRAETSYNTLEASRDVTFHVTAAPVSHLGVPAVMLTFEDRTAMQEAGQMRRDFVANVSHEMRTPLTALLGFIETLQGAARNDPEAQSRFLAIMHLEATRMNRLVNDLLSLSRVEGEERMRPTDPIALASLVRSVVLALRPLAQSAEVTLDLSVLDEDVEVPGDADQLRQVFTNLIENGIKYGGPGKTVAVRVHPEAREPTVRGLAVRVDVEDNGEGFDPVHIPRLTERFYRVDNHRSRELGGTGLGLAIVKHIVNRHRGRLKIASEPGTGSRFSVILPTA